MSAPRSKATFVASSACDTSWRRLANTVGAVAAAAWLTPATALACPVCETETGRQIRAGIFGAGFAHDVLLSVLPFVVMGVATSWASTTWWSASGSRASDWAFLAIGGVGLLLAGCALVRGAVAGA
jgi:hypothetical protein